MVTVKAGQALLGNTKYLKESYYTVRPAYYDWPISPVKFTYDFELSEKPETVVQFREFVMSSEGSPEEPALELNQEVLEDPALFPVTGIPYWRILKYLNWVSQKAGLPPAYSDDLKTLDKNGEITDDITKVAGYRLPTAAEWEYAARGGHLGDEGYTYPGSNNLNEVAWYYRNSGDAPYISPQMRHKMKSKHKDGVGAYYSLSRHPVGLKKPNALGLYDMAGNVWEWCTDLWIFGGSISRGTNPGVLIDPNIGRASYMNSWLPQEKYGDSQYMYPRTIRGGSFKSPDQACVIPFKRDSGITAQHPRDDIGFRVARTKVESVKEVYNG